ncbi:phage tail length tape measure family protein [Burkholderiaceae bacterium UC74_6]
MSDLTLRTVLTGDGGQLGATLNTAEKQIGTFTSTASKANAPLQATAANMAKVETSSKQVAAAMRGLPAQFTDIITSIQGGQAPMTVFLQQFGQIRDQFGSASAAASGVASSLSRLINPYTAVAAAAGLVAYQYYKGQQETDAFNKTVIFSGQVAGVTATQLAAIAKQTAQIAQGGTQARAAELLVGISSASGIAATNMARFTAAAMEFQRVGGTAAEEVLQAFQSLSKSPLDSALKLNETTNFLTTATYKQAKAYTDSGNSAKAAQVLQEAYFDDLKQKTADVEANLGIMTRAWRGVKDSASEAWDAMTIRQADIDQIKDNASKLSDFLSLFRGNVPAPLPYAMGVSSSSGSTAAAEASAAARAKEVQLAKDLATWDKEGVQYLTAQKQLALEIAKIREQGVKAGIDQAEINKRIAAATERFDPGIPQAQAAAQLAGVQRQLTQMTEAYKDADSIIAAQRQAGLLGDKEYYDAKGALIRANTEALTSGLTAENVYLTRINQLEKTSTAERIANQVKIKDNQAKIGELNSSAAAQTTVLGIQQQSAIDAVAKAYVQARQAAQDYLDTLRLNQNRELDLFTAGPGQRQIEQGRSQIGDRYSAERTRIQNERAALMTQQGGALTETQQRQYEQQLQLQNEFEKKALESYQDYVDRRRSLEGDWTTGAQQAWNEYLENARNVSQQTHDLLKNALDGGTDAMANFLAAGKYTWNELGRVSAQVAQQILADLLKIYIQKQIAGMVGSFFGAPSGSAGGFDAGNAYVSASVAHGGGTFGTDSFAQRSLPASTWASAPRHHTGLASDERAAVLLRNESVLTPGQMRQLAPANSVQSVSVNLPAINFINNSGTPLTGTTQRRPDGGFDVLVEAVEQSIAGNVASGAGFLEPAMRGRFGLKPAMSF